jgi:hypothetical protein
MRWYQSGTALHDVMVNHESEIKELLTTVPGFVAYFAVQDGGSVTTVTICKDKAGTDESTRRAAAWVKDNAPAGGISPPRISEGDTYMSFGM